MAEAKKYLFDNFIIEKTEICAAKEKEAAKTEEISEIAEDYSEIILSDAVEEEKYTSKQLEEAVKKAEEEGYGRGINSAQEGMHADTSNLLAEINNKLTKFFSDETAIADKLERQFLEISKSMIKTLLPNLAEENAVEIVQKFLSDNFANLKKEGKLSFYLHPDIIPLVQENIAKLADLNDYEGKISLHKDSGLLRSDCRIEWENGGVEYCTQGLFNKMNALVNKTIGEENDE